MLLLLSVSSISPLCAFDDAREVSVELMEIWREIVSSDEKTDEMKAMAALLWDSFPDATPDDQKLKKMYAGSFKRTYGVEPDSVALPLPRLTQTQEACHRVQGELTQKLSTCNDSFTNEQRVVAQTRALLDEMTKKRDTLNQTLTSCQETVTTEKNSVAYTQQALNNVNGKVVGLKNAMAVYTQSKDEVDRQNKAFKKLTSVEKQKAAAKDLEKAWSTHEEAVIALNNSFQELGIASNVETDERQKKNIAQIVDLYANYVE